MKLSIIYYSKTGKTKEMAEEVVKGMRSHERIEAGLFDVDHVDRDFLHESKAVVFGTPTYLASTTWQMKKWFDEILINKIDLGGKLGAAFSTAGYVQGGGDTAILTLVNNTVYADFVCDALIDDFRADRKIDVFSIRFKNESRLGDRIDVSAETLESGDRYLVGWHDRGTCFESLVRFK